MSEASLLFRRWTFRDGARAWFLARPSLATEAAFADGLEERAAEAASYLAQLDSRVGQAAWIAYRDDVENDYYGWCRPGFMTAILDPDNAVAFLTLWFAQCYPSGPLALSEADVKALWGRRADALFGMVLEVVQEPYPAHQNASRRFTNMPRPNLLECVAHLVDRGKGIPPWDVERLDRWTIANVLCHPRDEKTGGVTISAKRDTNRPQLSARDKFWQRWQAIGLPERVIEAQWEHRKRLAEANALEQRHG